MLIGLTMVIISQHTHVSKHHIVCLKYIQFLFVKYTSIKLEKNKKLKKEEEKSTEESLALINV